MMPANLAVYQNLIDAAKAAARNSYSPYSNFAVGSAVLASDGRIFTGCNVENASYGVTICAERTAIAKAVSEGCKDFEAVAVISTNGHNCWPCGICRQFISEFGVHINVVVEGEGGSLEGLKLSELLPRHFGPPDLGR